MQAPTTCTDHGLFGECIARTKLNVTAVTKIENIKFDFAITETQIETKTAPDPNSFTFAFAIKDNGGDPLFTNNGTCNGGVHDGKMCLNAAMCEGGTCEGLPPKNPNFDPVTANDSGIDAGADVHARGGGGAPSASSPSIGTVQVGLDFGVDTTRSSRRAQGRQPDPFTRRDEGTVQKPDMRSSHPAHRRRDREWWIDQFSRRAPGAT
jgi:hypothetical protein